MRDISERASLAHEVREFPVAELELRADGEDSVTFDGIASVVDTPYAVRDIFGEFVETMARGAFNKTLKEKADVRLLVNHDGVPLARTKSKTLQLSTTPDLRATAKLDPANPTVQEIRSAMGRGDMDQMSIGFRVTKQEWNGDYTERTIKEVELFDVSVVTFPASPTTTASIRSLDEFMATLTRENVDPDEARRAIAHLQSLIATRDGGIVLGESGPEIVLPLSRMQVDAAAKAVGDAVAAEARYQEIRKRLDLLKIKGA